MILSPALRRFVRTFELNPPETVTRNAEELGEEEEKGVTFPFESVITGRT